MAPLITREEARGLGALEDRAAPRQPDNGSDPRPDDRSGWLGGETPDVVEAFLDTAEQAREAGIEVRLWDPATQLRHAPKRAGPPRPDGAPNRWPSAA